ncbi:outer membrane fimbrial usher protein [Halomonas citrativorans]|uniref:Outer membrane fimbrial usher protein n=1 Tax=Halomonas citrativorans TaxID=2742612 RepID=A0A1R4I547_9GAMM|nr:outer membrane fimbrial usher protein [Halomonas citrativorans]
MRGTALTSARVIIRQHGQIIRETNVAPGPFIIDDLFDTSYNGDLNVEIIEADGTSSEFTVPFAAVPESMRPGLSNYSATIGQTTQYDNDWFGEATYQQGINNNLTLNLGARTADNYLALLGGGVVAGHWGALGLNATYSNARVERGERKQGWRLGASYSRTFQPTNTTLTLAGYRHSTAGYRDMTDVLGVRDVLDDGRQWDSYSHQQRNQFTLLINQNMGRYGALYFSGSASDYYGDKQKDSQFQFGYTNNWKQVSYGLSWSRQKNTYHQTYDDPTLPDSALAGSNTVLRGDVVSLNVSFPLGSSPKSPQLNTVYTQRSGDQAGHTIQTGLSGVMGRDNTFSYALAANQDSNYGDTSWNANVQQRGSLATLSAGYAHAHDYRQYSAGVRGGLVAHKGGVTLGPYLSDTFALVHAEGAEGAMVRHGQGSRINSSGYAIVPALSAFRDNSIRIDPQGLPSYTELLETEKHVVPYAGAMLYVSFDTRFGQAILIQSELEDGNPIPLGAAVSSEQERDIGVVGQGEQVYARVQEQQGALLIRWGDDDKHTCVISYDITSEDKTQDLIQLKAPCRNSSPILHLSEAP